MKKILFICLLSFLTLGISATYADSGKLSKTLQKEWKQQVKQLKKEGWTVWGKTQSIESALEAHYLQMQECGIEAVSIEGRGKAKTPNTAIRKATINAQVQYSSMKHSDVSGSTKTEITNTSGAETESKTEFEADYTSHTESKIKGFNPTVILCRETKDSNYEVLALFVVKE